MQSTRLDAHTERAVAVAAMVDPRTVRAYLSGRHLRSTCAARVAAALRQLGRDDLIRGPQPGQEPRA